MVEPTVTKFRLNSSFFCFKVFSAVCIFLSHYRGISLFPIPPGCHDLCLSNEHALALSTMHQTDLSSPLSFSSPHFAQLSFTVSSMKIRTSLSVHFIASVLRHWFYIHCPCSGHAGTQDLAEVSLECTKNQVAPITFPCSPWARTPKIPVQYHSWGVMLSYIFENYTSSSCILCMIAVMSE